MCVFFPVSFKTYDCLSVFINVRKNNSIWHVRVDPNKYFFSNSSPPFEKNMKFHFDFATAGRRRRPTRRIVTPSHIVTVAPGEDGEDGKSALDALLDTPRAGALSSDVSAATKSAQSTAALRVDIYSQTD